MGHDNTRGGQISRMVGIENQMVSGLVTGGRIKLALLFVGLPMSGLLSGAILLNRFRCRISGRCGLGYRLELRLIARPFIFDQTGQHRQGIFIARSLMDRVRGRRATGQGLAQLAFQLFQINRWRFIAVFAHLHTLKAVHAFRDRRADIPAIPRRLYVMTKQ